VTTDAIRWRSTAEFDEALARGDVIVFDGATGTNLQHRTLSADDFGGSQFEGCNELLNLTRPDVVADLHRSFLDVGVDVVETNTFGAFAIPLGEYGIGDRAYEIAAAGAGIAREAADDYASRDGRSRWVAGSIGPGTKFPTLGQVTYADLRDAYEIEARGLLDGGVDLIIVETQFDLLGAKAAITASRAAMTVSGREIPIVCQVTIELTGRMLPGTEVGSAVTTLDALGVDVIGLNCATGPEEMYEAVRYLSDHCRRPISIIPNAGLPKVVDGAMAYDLDPDGLANHLSTFVADFGVQLVGGCCGTTPEHLTEVVERVGGLAPKNRTPAHLPAAASTYSPARFAQDTSFLIIGERTNANGSRAFRDALVNDDVDTCVAIGTEQVAESAHLVDLCVDYVGRDGTKDMARLAARFATDITAPVVLDSTEPEVMEAGLQHLGGRSVLNSANLEDGDGQGSRVDRVFQLAREHGSAVICLLIDEKGQARTTEWKLEVAHRLYDIATNRYGLEPDSLIFDPLTFPLSTGGDDLRRDGIATLEAISRIKAELPGVYTVLGVSNISFGLNPAARKVLNSVFLHEAVEHGLDAAIVHAGKLLPYHVIDPEHRDLCLDLVYDQRRPGYDPLQLILDAFSDVTATVATSEDELAALPIEERLQRRIVDGNRVGLEADLDEAMASGHSALGVVNDILLGGMKTVGELFASGDMQLPFVLKSAETMKTAVAYLEPHMDKADTAERGSIVLATVQGDVHDIGKNLVDIILTNNGFKVHNLGIKVPVDTLIDTYTETGADAIGMSGLLVKSTLIMRDNLAELTRRGLDEVPVLLGGAALTRRYVEEDLRSQYAGPLFYGKDAFAGLAAMSTIADGAGIEAPPPRQSFRHNEEVETLPAGTVPARSPSVATDNTVFKPPFLGSRVIKSLSTDEIAPYLNLTALFRNQWQYRPERGENHPEFLDRLKPLLAEQLNQARVRDLLVPQVVYGYFPANGDGDDLIVWEDESRSAELARFTFPRQSEDPFMCISDFHRQIDSGELDYVAFHLVTMGGRISEHTAELFAADRYTDYLHLHGLGVEMAEALAEYWHHRIRTEWGFVDEDGPTLTGLFKQQYRGGRYSWGYPACPDLEDNQTVADLLGAARIGIEVSAETGYQYQPEQSTSAIICHHPQAKYFIARKPREARRADR
jgi:5-methyltetrahydrofolate--homocysteine methyltransferase